MRIARGYHAAMACVFAVVLVSCVTDDPAFRALAQNDQEEAGRERTPGPADLKQIVALFHRQLSACWTPPVGANVSDVSATVRFMLNRDGSLSGEPTLVKTTIGTIGAQSQAVAESALRAVRRCAPFKLPAAKYELWKDVEVNFDRRMMASPDPRDSRR